MITAAHFQRILVGLAAELGFLRDLHAIELVTMEDAKKRFRASVDSMLEYEMSEDQRARLGKIRARAN